MKRGAPVNPHAFHQRQLWRKQLEWCARLLFYTLGHLKRNRPRVRSYHERHGAAMIGWYGTAMLAMLPEGSTRLRRTKGRQGWRHPTRLPPMPRISPRDNPPPRDRDEALSKSDSSFDGRSVHLRLDPVTARDFTTTHSPDGAKVDLILSMCALTFVNANNEDVSANKRREGDAAGSAMEKGHEEKSRESSKRGPGRYSGFG